MAGELISKAEESNIDFVLPADNVIADNFSNDANRKTVNRDEIADGWMGMDIGPKTIEHIDGILDNAATVVWNGPMGVFEMPNFATGTNAVAKKLAEITSRGAVTVVGGGDSAAAIEAAGLSDRISHISTGGGASLEFLEGKELPGLEALSDK
jgi:phosphoglycerate kinase